MNRRSQAFIKKFVSTQHVLNEPNILNIVSLKHRELCVSNSDYRHFVDEYIKANLGLNVKELNGEFLGNAWLVFDTDHNQVILVEHETGLEILYIASSIASLMSLVPLICSGWKYFRGRFSHRSPFDNERNKIEIRKLNASNVLIEQHSPSFEAYVVLGSLQANSELIARIDHLEQEIETLKMLLSQDGEPAQAESRQKRKMANKSIQQVSKRGKSPI